MITTENESSIIRRTISIRPDQDAWLKNHRELNFSAFVQKKLDEEIERREEAV